MNYEQRKRDMQRMRGDGMTLRAIAARFSVSYQRVEQIIGSTGRVSDFFVRFDEQQTENIKAMRTANYTVVEIASAMGCSAYPIDLVLTGFKKFSKYPEGFKKCYRCKKVLDASWWYANTERCIPCVVARQADYNASHPEKVAEYLKLGKEKRRCRSKTHRLIRNGQLHKGPCKQEDSECQGRIEAHHYAGYDRPDLVEWYCAKHHRNIDGAKWKKVADVEALAHAEQTV